MLSEEMLELGKKRSAIREIFEYGKARARQIGADNVFDFSIGNPNVPPPGCIKETIVSLLATEDPVLLHGALQAGHAFVSELLAAGDAMTVEVEKRLGAG